MTCYINASSPSTLGVWAGVESVENKAISRSTPPPPIV